MSIIFVKFVVRLMLLIGHITTARIVFKWVKEDTGSTDIALLVSVVLVGAVWLIIITVCEVTLTLIGKS